MSSLTVALRRLVRERAALRCEYCLLAEDDAYLPHEPDHVIALEHGGVTDVSNLALACFDCNRYKGSGSASVSGSDSVSVSCPRSQLADAERAVQLRLPHSRVQTRGPPEVLP